MCNFHSSLWSFVSVFDNPEGCQVMKHMDAHIQATEGATWYEEPWVRRSTISGWIPPLVSPAEARPWATGCHVSGCTWCLGAVRSALRAYTWRGSRGRRTLYFVSISSGHREQEVSCSESCSLASCTLSQNDTCVCVRWFCTVRGLELETAAGGGGWSWRRGPCLHSACRRPPPGRAARPAPHRAGDRKHLPRELLLQLPQALPGGLHVPQELGYFIVLGFGELHASRRQEMAELCRSGPEQRGGERREAAHPRSGDRGDGPPGRPLLPAHRSHGAGNCRPASRSSAPRPGRGGERGGAARPGGESRAEKRSRAERGRVAILRELDLRSRRSYSCRLLAGVAVSTCFPGLCLQKRRSSPRSWGSARRLSRLRELDGVCVTLCSGSSGSRGWRPKQGGAGLQPAPLQF